MKRITGLLVAVVALVAASPGISGEIVEQSRSFSSTGEISIDIVSGTVVVRAWDKDEVSIRAEVEGAEKYFEIDWEEGEVRIEHDPPDRDEKGWKKAREWKATVDLVVRVPAGVSLDATGINLDVTVEGVTGDVELEAVNGDLLVNGDASSVEIESVNGRIEVTGDVSQVEAESVSGRIRLHEVSGRVTAETVSGDVDITGGPFGDLEAGTVSGTVSVSGAPSRGASWDLESHSGDLTLRLPENASADIEAETFSGGIENALGPVAERTDRYAPGEEVSFRLGSGSAEISLSTFSGRLRILPMK